MLGFLEKIKSGKAKASNGGFKGKGLERFDKKREEKNNAEKATYGDTSEALSLSSREGAVIPYKPKTNEYKPPDTAQARGEADYTFTEIKVDIIKGPAPDKAINPALYGTGTGRVSSSSSSSTTTQLPQATLDALKKARAEGRNVDAANLQKVIARLQQAIDLGMKNQPMSAAVASSFSFSSKPKDPDATDYHAIFPINDYPQKARWKATNKEQMTMLSEISGASITMRGVYYPPGEDPPISGEPKLHLLLESNDERKVRAAIDEIRRNLVEASMLALDVRLSRVFWWFKLIFRTPIVEVQYRAGTPYNRVPAGRVISIVYILKAKHVRCTIHSAVWNASTAQLKIFIYSLYAFDLEYQ